MSAIFPARPAARPTTYAYSSTHPDHAGLLKVGYTERNATERIAEQLPAGLLSKRPDIGCRIHVCGDFL